MNDLNLLIDTPAPEGQPAEPLKVSQLIAMLKADVEKKYQWVRVIGELSSFKQWRSGHCYFDIKDEQALLPAVMFKPHFARLPFKPGDGLQVVASGRASIYAANARLQMVVESMEPLGQGALALAFEQLKQKLSALGLFQPEHKKPIRPFNQCVGLITSSHGAVIRDMLRILKSRMPKVDILFSPVRVQGVGAAQEIAYAIDLLDQMGACDVIIVGRGGGSLEDLWAFNEEVVAQAIFRAKTPIISAVGHETDFTISDFVADIRAATPTHAATLAVPIVNDLLDQLVQSRASLRFFAASKIKNAWLRLALAKQQLKDPRLLLFRHWQKLDESARLLQDRRLTILNKNQAFLASLKQKLELLGPLKQLHHKKEALFGHKLKLLKLAPSSSLMMANNKLMTDKDRLDLALRSKLAQARQGFEQGLIKFNALSPLEILARGYSFVRAADGRILNKLDHFDSDQIIKIRVSDGVVNAIVVGKEQ